VAVSGNDFGWGESPVHRGLYSQAKTEQATINFFPFACGKPPVTPDLSEASTVQRGITRQFQLTPTLHPFGGEVSKDHDNQFHQLQPPISSLRSLTDQPTNYHYRYEQEIQEGRPRYRGQGA
jgi:hypothetical protein